MSLYRNRTLKPDALPIVIINISLDLYVEKKLNIKKPWSKAELVLSKTGYSKLPWLGLFPPFHLDVFIFPALSFTLLPLQPEFRKECTTLCPLLLHVTPSRELAHVIGSIGHRRSQPYNS